jgi:hypothetical protein
MFTDSALRGCRHARKAKCIRFAYHLKNAGSGGRERDLSSDPLVAEFLTNF